MDDVRHELLTRLDKLSPMQQKQVLDYTRDLLGEPRQLTPGKNLLQFAGAISPEDLEIMKQAIEEGCEQVIGYGKMGIR